METDGKPHAKRLTQAERTRIASYAGRKYWERCGIPPNRKPIEVTCDGGKRRFPSLAHAGRALGLTRHAMLRLIDSGKARYLKLSPEEDRALYEKHNAGDAAGKPGRDGAAAQSA